MKATHTPEQINELIAQLRESDISTKNISDTYHTFGELYYHRALLFCVICSQNKEIAWKATEHHDGTMFDGMFIVGLDTPQGQYTYHYNMNMWDLFDVKVLDQAPMYDGHKPEDITRLLSLI